MGDIRSFERWADAYENDFRIWRKGEPRPDYRDVIIDRINTLNNIRTDDSLIPYLKAYYESNPVAFILDWCITYDPRNIPPVPKTMPFCVFPRQIDMVQFIYESVDNQTSGLWEKSRDYGATWIACAVSVHMWLFEPGTAIGFGSRKAELVDQLGDPKTIFAKIRQIIENLPDFLLPDGLTPKLHLTYMRCINPENGSTIIGEGGDNVGRGGRTSVYFLDEAAHVERPELIEASLGDNTNVRIDISSVNGIGNPFYRRRMNGKEWTPGDKMTKAKANILVLDWRDHPDKDQEWYDNRKKRSEEEGLSHVFAQEVDRDYAASVKGVLIPAKWVRCVFDHYEELCEMVPKSGKKIAGQDAADGGSDSSALVISHGVHVELATTDSRGADEAAPALISMAMMSGVEDYYYESTGVGAGVRVATKMMNVKSFAWTPNASVVNPYEDMIGGTQIGEEGRKSNRDYFRDYKAQSSWALRMRFKRVYDFYNEGKQFDADEIIIINPKMLNADQLERELSQPTYSTNGAGKIVIDKKPNGTKSPNLFDALVICMSPKQKLVAEETLDGVGISGIDTPDYGDSFF